MTNQNLNLRASVNGLGAWANTYQSPRVIDAGNTARFTVQFYHQKDGPVNPTGLTAVVYQGVISTYRKTLATLTPLQDKYGTGSYFAEYSVPMTQGAGPIYCEYAGTYTSSDNPTPEPVLVRIYTRVVQPARD
jgi:hypothetical protein